MYKISGELLPGVFHVGACAGRTVAVDFRRPPGRHGHPPDGIRHAGDSSVQEVMDLAGVAHIVSLKSRVPFLHFFDGFRTSHEIQKMS